MFPSESQYMAQHVNSNVTFDILSICTQLYSPALADCPTDHRADPQRAVSSPAAAQSASSEEGACAEAGGGAWRHSRRTDYREVCHCWECCLPVRQNADIASPGASTMDKIRWNTMRILFFLCCAVQGKKRPSWAETKFLQPRCIYSKTKIRTEEASRTSR